MTKRRFWILYVGVFVTIVAALIFTLATARPVGATANAVCTSNGKKVQCTSVPTRTPIPPTPTYAPTPTPIKLRGCLEGIEYKEEFTTINRISTTEGISSWADICINGKWTPAVSK